MENIEKETVSSKFMENPYIEMKKKISVNGIVALVIAILAFVGSSAVSDPQSSLKLFLIVLGAGLLVYGLIRLLQFSYIHCFALFPPVLPLIRYPTEINSVQKYTNNL